MIICKRSKKKFLSHPASKSDISWEILIQNLWIFIFGFSKQTKKIESYYYLLQWLEPFLRHKGSLSEFSFFAIFCWISLTSEFFRWLFLAPISPKLPKTTYKCCVINHERIKICNLPFLINRYFWPGVKDMHIGCPSETLQSNQGCSDTGKSYGSGSFLKIFYGSGSETHPTNFKRLSWDHENTKYFQSWVLK